MKLKILKEGETVVDERLVSTTLRLVRERKAAVDNLEHYVAENLNCTREGKFIFDELERMGHALIEMDDFLMKVKNGQI